MLMTLALSIITLVSLATTGTLLIYVARLLRDERERTQARVAALSAAIWLQHTPSAIDQESDDVFARGSDLPLSTAAGVSNDSRPLFAEPGANQGSDTRHWMAPVAGVLIVTALVGAGTLATMDSRRGADVANVTGERVHDAPLQLLSLRHQREGESLAVSGLVRNPSGAPVRQHTDVVIFTFDRTGAFIASARAAVADPSLAAGSESPFSVPIPNGANVSRYRISFRVANRMLPHVDRRQDGTAGQVDAPIRGTDDRSVRTGP
jgi:hypothetical protein